MKIKPKRLDRSKMVWKASDSQPKLRGSGGQRPLTPNLKFFDFFSIIFRIFYPRWGARDLSAVRVLALYNTWRPKQCRKTKPNKFGFFVVSDSIDSIIRSIRSRRVRVLFSVRIFFSAIFQATSIQPLFQFLRPPPPRRGPHRAAKS